MRALWMVLLAAVLSGCAGLGEQGAETPSLIKPPQSAEEAVLIAQDYAARGRWQAAVDVLDRALLADTENATLRLTRDTMAARWRDLKQLLEDRITIGDAENAHAKIALLEQLSSAAPNDLVVASRRLYWKELLRGKALILTDCAERHVSAEPALAQRCYRIAADIVQDEKLEQRLAAVRDGLKEGEQLAEERQRRRAQKERQLRAKVLLGEARVAIDANDHRKALDILQRVKKLQPRNPEVAALQKTAWSMISPQIEALVKLGDHLYLDEQLTAAVATWQAALNLKPGDEEIAARIERARTVLERLESLRERQKPPNAAAVPE